MKPTTSITLAVLLALGIAAAPVRAGEPQGRDDDHARHAQNRTPPRSGQERSGRPAVASAVPRGEHAQPRQAAAPAPRVQQHEQASPSAPRIDRRQENRAVPRASVFGAPRSDDLHAHDHGRYGSSGYYYGDHGYYEHNHGRTVIVAPGLDPSYSYGYRPYHPYHPYYAFRPRFRIGFGVFIGYPVAYPYAIYPSPARVYGYYPPPGTVSVAPSYASYGGVSLEIGPPDADVYVDGAYVGRAEDFGPTEPPLTMLPGRHRIELAAPGYETLAFDVDVVPGEVVPYQGALRPY